MKRLSLLTLPLLAALLLLGAACGGDSDDGDDGDGDASSPTEAATSAPTEAAGNGGGAGTDTDGEFFQISGTGVLMLVVDGESYEFDVTCSADKGKTLGDEPQWDYSLESDDPEAVIQGTYQLVDDEETFKSLLVNGGGLTLSANEFSDVTSGGTEWAGSFTSAGIGGMVEGTFETSCS